MTKLQHLIVNLGVTMQHHKMSCKTSDCDVSTMLLKETAQILQSHENKIEDRIEAQKIIDKFSWI